MSQEQVEKEKREEKERKEKKEEKAIQIRKSVSPVPLEKTVSQKIVRFKKVKVSPLILAPRLKLEQLILFRLAVKRSVRTVSKITKSPHFILCKLLNIRIPISKFLTINSSRLGPVIFSISPSIRVRMPYTEPHRVKLSKLSHPPKLKSSPSVFPSSKIFINQTVKMQAQPMLSFEAQEVMTGTMQETEIAPNKEEEIVEVETIPLGEGEEPEDLFELLFEWEDPEKLEKLRNALTSPTATCIFLVPNNETFHGELVLRKILATEFKRSYGEIDAKHDASSDLSDRSKHVVTISKDKVEKLARMLRKSRKRSAYGE